MRECVCARACMCVPAAGILAQVDAALLLVSRRTENASVTVWSLRIALLAVTALYQNFVDSSYAQ